jgi:Helix-turn-helix domain
MFLHRASQYKLEPTDEQAAAFAQWAGACRHVYNLALCQ